MDSQKMGAKREARGELDLLASLQVLAKHAKMIVAATLSALILSIVVSLCLPKIYSATARILPPQQDNSLLSMMMGTMGGAGGLASLAGGILGGSPSDLYVGILKTEALRDPIIDRFKLMQVYDDDYRLDTYKTLDRKVDISAGKKDGIISIEVEDKDPKRAAALANALVQELARVVVRLSVTDATQDRTFLDQRLKTAKADLARAEEAMTSFAAKNKAVSVPDQAKASIEGVALLKAQLAAQEAQLSAVRSQYTDSTPEVQAVRASIAKISAQVGHLEGKGTGAIPSVGSIPALGQEYLRLMRQLKMQETLVELLSKQDELSKFSQAKAISGIQIVQEARVPDKKSKPKRLFIVLGATFLTFSAAVFASFLLENLQALTPEEQKRWRTLVASLGFRRAGPA